MEQLSDNAANWREVWRKRIMITCGSEKRMEKWIEKHQREFKQPLLLDRHPKDGFVVFHN
ncbi:hypothetical protein ACFVS2_26530 [Brevibacillus sp. NPDC058079]|uniref:hypothetical protein n=1 Tax=Brevibacillus sp. NPDC058079 TaxID=3346330 RepID=UPI0036DFEF83